MFGELAELYATEAEEADSDAEKVVLYRKAAEIHTSGSGDRAAAAKLLERALAIQSDDRDLMLALCDEYTASGRGADAIDMLNKVVESYGGRRSKELADIHHRIASAYLAQGDEEGALRELDSARKMDPGSIRVLADLGTLSIGLADRAGDDATRQEHLKRAGNVYRSLMLQRLEESTLISKAEVFYYMAEVNKRENDQKKAIHNLERALAADKDLEKAKALLDELKG